MHRRPEKCATHGFGANLTIITVLVLGTNGQWAVLYIQTIPEYIFSNFAKKKKVKTFNFYFVDLKLVLFHPIL